MNAAVWFCIAQTVLFVMFLGAAAYISFSKRGLE